MNEEEEKAGREILRHVGLSEEEISVAISLAQKDETFGNIKDFMAGAKHEAIAPDVLDLAMLGDRLASMKDPSEPVYKDTEARLKRLGLFITYHKVSVVRGISTYLLHRALIELYQQKGFAPVLFFSSGVVYVGKKEAPRLTREEVLRSLEETLTSFLREKKRELGRAAIGVVSQKAIKAPEYVFVDEDVAKALWNLLTKQKSVADPSVKDNDLSAKGFGSYLGDELTLGEREAAIKFYKGMKYLLTYFNNLLKSAKEDFGVKDAEEIAKKTFKEEFGEELPDSVLGVIFQTPNQEAKASIDLLSKSLNLKGYNLKEAFLRIKPFLIKTTEKIASRCKQEALRSFKLEDLLKDLVYPSFESPMDLVKDAYSSYLTGKTGSGSVVCPNCGQPSEVVGVAAVHGDGVEGFSNSLRGGSRAGGRNKLHFCAVCDLEAKLRALILDGWNKGDVLFLVPMINSSPALLKALWDEVSKLIRKISVTTGLIDEGGWSRTILENKLVKGSAEIWESIVRSIGKNRRKRVVKKFAEIIRQEYGSLEVAAKELAPEIGKEVSSFEDIASILIDKGEIPEDLLDALEVESNSFLLTAENYMVLFLNKKIAARKGREEESETSAMIRKLFYALLFATMMQVSAIYAPIPISVVSAEIRPRGYASVPIKLGMRDVLERLGIWKAEKAEGEVWVKISKADDVLFRLACLMSVSRALYDVYGKDFL
ncbi:MAG: hypothetical protein DRN92_09480, partial [Thermoproteota archaeon]